MCAYLRADNIRPHNLNRKIAKIKSTCVTGTFDGSIIKVGVRDRAYKKISKK